ncbi:MAG: hypothetical protein HWN65_09775 [Candidatus Helarchaeota archaeon]|nr:hypothetical protein [Candidatus Helarchaeota archaeon]
MKDLRNFLVIVLGVSLITLLIMIGIFAHNIEQYYNWSQLYTDWNGSRYTLTGWGYISIIIFGGLVTIALYLNHSLPRRIAAYVLMVIAGIFLALLIYSLNSIVIANAPP